MQKHYIREFEFEHSRSKSYFDLMYKIFQFTFALVTALLAIAFRLEALNEKYINIIFQYILPVCMYVLGIMYAYNAYALAVCGRRAELLHEQIYTNIENPDGKNKDVLDCLRKYVLTDRRITLISYGVPLVFYIVIPIASCIVGGELYPSFFQNSIMQWIPYFLYIIYFIIMFIVIRYIRMDFFFINKIQDKYKRE